MRSLIVLATLAATPALAADARPARPAPVPTYTDEARPEPIFVADPTLDRRGVINPKAGEPANCPATSRYEASKRGKSPKAQKLNELPDADLYRAVYRHIGSCEAPIIVKFGVVGR